MATDPPIGLIPVWQQDGRDAGDRETVRELRLARRGLRRAFMSESREIWGSELLYETPHKTLCCGSECAQAVNAKKESGRVVWIR